MMERSVNMLFVALALALVAIALLTFPCRCAMPAPPAESMSDSQLDHADRVPAHWRSYGRVDRLAPCSDDGQIRFRYEDEGYLSVSLTGDFLQWEELPMEHDVADSLWEVRVDLTPGRHVYEFVVEDSTGWSHHLDAGNPQVARHRGHGWVSVVSIGRDGEVLSPERRYRFDVECDLDDDLVAYQRADGLVLSLRGRMRTPEPFQPALSGNIGYGFRSKRWSTLVTVSQPVTRSRSLCVEASGFAHTDYTDQTGIGSGENSAAAIFFKEDFRDYYRSEGGSIGVVLEPSEALQVRGEFRAVDYTSLPNTADWSFGRGEFIPNPPIDAGSMRSLFVQARLGSRLRSAQLSYEHSGRDLFGGDFEFRQLTGQLRTRLRMGRDQILDLRVRSGTNLHGVLPQQKRYVVGGLGTVRGYPYQTLLVPDPAAAPAPGTAPPLGGERVFLANAEYVFPVIEDVQAVLLFDTGMAWADRAARIDPGQWKSSIGMGLQLGDDDLRVEVLKRLDRGERDVLVQLRLNRAF
jgi:hypothetical protein